MNLLVIIITVVVVGFLLYVINRLIPMQPTIKNILNVVVILILIVWLLKVFGILDSMQNVQV